jgi:hypothetical protein
MRRVLCFIISLVLILSVCLTANADEGVLNISESNISHEVSDTLYTVRLLRIFPMRAMADWFQILLITARLNIRATPSFLELQFR